MYVESGGSLFILMWEIFLIKLLGSKIGFVRGQQDAALIRFLGVSNRDLHQLAAVPLTLKRIRNDNAEPDNLHRAFP